MEREYRQDPGRLLGETAEERDFFERPEDEAAREISRYVGIPHGMESGCQPKWLTRERAGLFGAFLAIGGVSLTDTAIEKYQAKVSAEAAADQAEDEKGQEHLERMKRAFSEAAERVRTSGELTKFTPAQREVVAEELANFPIERLFSELGEMSGMEANDLAGENDVSFITVYNDDDAYNFVSYVEQSLGASTEGAAEEMARTGAGFSFERQAIFLNLSQIQDENLETMREKFRDVTTHEIIHGFKHKNFGADDRIKILYEGGVEDAANAVGSRVWPDTSVDPYSGYMSGGTALSQIVRGSMDAQDYWQSLLTDDVKRVQTNFDATYGAESFQTALHTGSERSYAAVPTFGSEAAIQGFLAAIDRENPGEADLRLAQVNAERRTGKLYQWQNENWTGLLVVSDQTETGFAGGFLEERGAAGEPKAVFLSGNLEHPIGTIDVPSSRGNAAVLFDRLADYNGQATLDEAPAAEVQGAIDSMMESYVEKVDLLRENHSPVIEG